MKIKSITFKAPEPKLKIIKSVNIYLSEKHSEIIIAPISKEPVEHYHYEQEICEKIDLNSPFEKIGEAVIRNFKKFDIKEKENGIGKLSDWSAVKLSKEKSARGFNHNYTKIIVTGLTDLNNTLRIETRFGLPIEIELMSIISAHCEFSDLGQRILKMFNSEITRRI